MQHRYTLLFCVYALPPLTLRRGLLQVMDASRSFLRPVESRVFEVAEAMIVVRRSNMQVVTLRGYLFRSYPRSHVFVVPIRVAFRSHTRYGTPQITKTMS